MLLNRWAISALSRKNKNNALIEEIMVHKETGQILIKTKDSDIISYDSLSRVRQHINKLTADAIGMDFLGDMYSIELDNIELPEAIELATDLVGDTPITIAEADITKILVSFDIDSVILGSTDPLVSYEPHVRYDLFITDGVDERYIINNATLGTINTSIIDLRDYIPVGADPKTYQVYITSIFINKDPNVTAPQIRTILNNILFVKG